jgi:hypothetical protein
MVKRPGQPPQSSYRTYLRSFQEESIDRYWWGWAGLLGDGSARRKWKFLA